MGEKKRLVPFLACALVAPLLVEGRTRGGPPETIDCARRDAIPVRAEPLVAPVEGLEALPGIPLPTLGPEAGGHFHPQRGYLEGGRFGAARERPEWTVTADEALTYRRAQGIPERTPGALRVVEFNIARGEHLDALIRLLKMVDVDVILGNEGDLYGRVTGGRVAAREIARGLGCSYVTNLEFYELRDDRRGTSGNFIVSCAAPLRDAVSMRIPIPFGAFNWDASLDQPRCGERSALSAYVDLTDASGDRFPVQLATLHTENWAFSGSRRKMFESVREAFLVPGGHAIWGGDLNTLAPFEASGFGRYLDDRLETDGPQRALRDCSRGDHTKTAGPGHIDWVMLQSPDGSVDCPETDPTHGSGSYLVLDPLGTSDHNPVFVHVTVGSASEPPPGWEHGRR